MIENLRNYLQNLLGTFELSWASLLVQILIIILLLSFLYFKVIKNSPAEKTVKGIVVFLFAIWMLAECCSFFHLRILGAMLKNMILLLIVSGVVLFQPELRRLMARLGNHVSLSPLGKKKIITNQLSEMLLQTITYWRKTKTGALLVFEHQEPVNANTTGGVKIDALLSGELLINLFFINTPLHDGAVIIKGNRIVSAGSILPLTKDVNLTWQYGTRHRAAIGLTEVSDALCLVVSEETGHVSFIQNGQVKTYDDMGEIEKELSRFLMPLVKKEADKSLWQKIKELKK